MAVRGLKILACICLMSLPGSVWAVRISQIWANSTALQVHWRPGGGRFCLCHATAEHFQQGLSSFDCIPYHRESRCDMSDFGNCSGTTPGGLRCSAQNASAGPSVLSGLRPGITYAFCAIDGNPLAVSGFDDHALCTRTWTMDSELNFRASVYSNFMVGLKWRMGNETEQLLNVRLCSSADGCEFACKDNLIDVRREKFVAWADLTTQKLRMQVRRTDGALLYENVFDSRKETPNRPCSMTASALGTSTVRVSWELDGAADGFVVSHCWFRLCHSRVYPEPKLRHVYVNGLLCWSRYRFSVATFRTINRTGVALSEPIHAEVDTGGGETRFEHEQPERHTTFEIKITGS
ncbi:hypothetical protein IscW_ISCW001493 [Ixodes scapularis]|uniref:Fibronectin type III domaincontaining protein n=1 Tax=Ixodes scapularis TaxID=6945 RepID=B7P5G3_IXOSC|nr:hypothetical protein IscW_ISCW001493 [Ixodes scapularis]|eukprot:XP_002407338.1 hypothetical protein IscW_ISCW001493 [Ixodes scapularis]